MIYDELYDASLKKAKHKIWIFSDLQQSFPELAKRCLDISMVDFYSMGKPAEMMWYLGDAVEGANPDLLYKMTELQISAFENTKLPLCFVMGNHDLDYPNHDSQKGKSVILPFYEAVKMHTDWYTIEDYSKWYFKVPLGNYMVYFFSDHIADDKSWIFHREKIEGAEYYPNHDIFEKVRAEMSSETCDIITCSHYSFSGGNRASEIMSKLLPLPYQHKIHFYGHAHIGDYAWAKENAYRRISNINWHDIPQINVSSFENIRGNTCRSVFLHIYEDNSMGIFFRNHDDHVFTECYFPAKVKYNPKLEAFT